MVSGGARKRWVGARAAVLAGFLIAPAAAAETGPAAWLGSVELHGFAGQGFLRTTGNDYLVIDSKKGSFQLSEIGLNVGKELSDRLRFGVQFFAQNFGRSGSYTPQVDWFFLDYRFADWLGLRAGRLKVPWGLFNEVHDVDAGRVPILLPQSVYPQQARSFLFAQTGAELYGFLRSPALGGLEYRAFAGTVFIDPKVAVPVGTPVELQLNVRYVFGGRLVWETPLSGLRLSASALKLHLDTTAFLPMGVMVGIDNDSWAAIGSIELTRGGLSVTAEYTRGYVDQRSVVPTSNFERTEENAYLMLSYAVASWLSPGIYYSIEYPNVERRSGLENQQRDLALTLRFDVNANWLWKAEGHYMAGTAGLANPLQIGPPPANPATRWAVFLLKTTVYF